MRMRIIDFPFLGVLNERDIYISIYISRIKIILLFTRKPFYYLYAYKEKKARLITRLETWLKCNENVRDWLGKAQKAELKMVQAEKVELLPKLKYLVEKELWKIPQDTLD